MKEGLLVDDMNDAVRDENIRLDNTRAVDEDARALLGDPELATAESGNVGIVHEGGAVADGALDDVILKDAGELAGA